MDITFIFGNGFDIQLGLKTSYSDFLREYAPGWNDASDSENICKFKEYLNQANNRELWADAEKAMGLHLQNYNDDTIEDYHERIEDFETQMIEYLESQQARCSYIEKWEIGRIFLDFISLSHNDVLNDRLSDSRADDDLEDTYNFITFNYTDLLDNVVSCCLNNKNITLNRNIFHVHGTLDTQIVMGVNDESQLDLRGGVTLTELIRDELIKPQMNRRFKTGCESEAKAIINNSDVIYTYGISYGETDKMWWGVIKEWLKKDSKHKLIVFIKDQLKGVNSKLPWHISIYEDRKRRDILKKLGVRSKDVDYKRLLNQVYIILNTTRLNLKELVLSNEQNEQNTGLFSNLKDMIGTLGSINMIDK